MVDESTAWLQKIEGNDQGLNKYNVWGVGRYRVYREALDAAAPRDFTMAQGLWEVYKLSIKMARTGNQISPAES